jgi:hypothetical protein
MYHAVALELGVGVQDAVGGRVVACCVHGIGACLVEGRLRGRRVSHCLLRRALNAV